MNENDYLIHYGVLGMKWGVRRNRNKDGTLTSAGKKRANKEAKKAYKSTMRSRKKTKFEDISNMSDKELNERINRMRMEQQYAQLLSNQYKVVSTGKTKTDNKIAKETNLLVSEYAKKYAKKGLKRLGI